MLDLHEIYGSIAMLVLFCGVLWLGHYRRNRWRKRFMERFHKYL